MTTAHKPIFRGAISDEHGDVDVGYLALIWGLVGWGASVIVVLAIGAIAAWRGLPGEVAAILIAMGTSIGYISGGFATMLGAVGIFRYGDRARPLGAGTTQTFETSKTIVTPAAPAATPANPMPVEIIDNEPVRVTQVKPPAAPDKPTTKGKR